MIRSISDSLLDRCRKEMPGLSWHDGDSSRAAFMRKSFSGGARSTADLCPRFAETKRSVASEGAPVFSVRNQFGIVMNEAIFEPFKTQAVAEQIGSYVRVEQL
jgi:hypothetical protein